MWPQWWLPVVRLFAERLRMCSPAQGQRLSKSCGDPYSNPFKLPGNFDYQYVNRDAHYSGQKRSCSSAQVASVKAPGHSRVGSALDDGAAIWEKCDLVIVGPKFQNEIAMPHLAVRTKRTTQSHEIHRALALVDLYRVPAAHS